MEIDLNGKQYREIVIEELVDGVVVKRIIVKEPIIQPWYIPTYTTPGPAYPLHDFSPPISPAPVWYSTADCTLNSKNRRSPW